MILLRKHYGPLLRILHCATDQAITAALESMELTSAQGHILGFLATRREPPCPKDVEEAFRLSHPTVSGLLTRLEKKGFIALKPDGRDRRCKRIFLLPRGEECLGTLHATILDSERRLVAGFTEEEQNQFLALLRRAVDNMDGWPCGRRDKEESQA